MDDERKPWEWMECEPIRWYRRFCIFNNMGPARSIEAVYRGECEALHREVKRPSKVWYERAKQWQWLVRARLSDEDKSEKEAAAVEAHWKNRIMGPNETIGRLSEFGRNDFKDFSKIGQRWTEDPLPSEEIIQEEEFDKPLPGGIFIPCKRYLVRKVVLDLDALRDPVRSFRVKKFTDSPKNGLSIELYSAQDSLGSLGKHHKLFDPDDDQASGSKEAFSLPADSIAPKFLDAYDDIREHNHTEYVFSGGRGSTKSSFISLAIIYLIINNPEMHGIALRQVANTLRDSVYSQLCWAISELGLDSDFKCTTSPLEITYRPTGQHIYFRGADEPGKIKSIKPEFGYIGIAWFEELDQFHGPESIRNIEQSAIRGGDLAYIFKSFNPPRSAANWANKYIQIPKTNQYLHHSTYLELGSRVRWLGKPWIEEAEHLKMVNPGAYEHEYLGVANGTGGLVFENVRLEKITDDQIAQFDRITSGQDWGWYPDPAHFGRVHYDAARRILYIFAEYRAWKKNNKQLYEGAKEHAGYMNDQLVIADSAEPKSVADWREYGANCRGAEKGPDSVAYSMKWMQGLTAIVIDPERCPYTMQEFIDYEYEQDKDGNYISAYPDINNHAIDMTRYATNLIWRRRGQ